MKSINKFSNINAALIQYFKQNKEFYSNIKINICYDQLIKDKRQRNIYDIAIKYFSKIGSRCFKNNDEYIYVSNGDVKESIAKAISNSYQKKFVMEHTEIFKILDKIVENGIMIASALEQKRRDKFSRWDYYITLVYINDKPFVIEFDTVFRVDNNNEKHFRMARIYSFDEIKNKLF